MREVFENEKAKLQGLFDWPNRDGSWLRVENPRGEPLRLGLVDSFSVTRIAPEISAAGEIRRVAFWLMWKSAGYDEGPQFVHTVKVLEWRQEDPNELDFRDDRGWWHHVEGLVPPHEPEYVADWRRWQRYKAENRERFELLDASLLEEHVRLAEEWGQGE